VERNSIIAFVPQMWKEIFDTRMGFASMLIRRQVRRILVHVELDSLVELLLSIELVSSSEPSKPIYKVVEAKSCLKIIWRISVGTVMSVLGMFFESFEVVDTASSCDVLHRLRAREKFCHQLFWKSGTQFSGLD